MHIGRHNTDRRVFIVAEIGNCHEGDAVLAEEMVWRAAEAGADAVKFQTITPVRLVSPRERERVAQLERFRLSLETFRHLAQVAGMAGVEFLSTPFDVDAVEFLDALVPAFKVASGDNAFHPLLAAVAATGKPVLLSTGLVGLEDVRRSIAYLHRHAPGGALDVAALHCVSAYPTPPEQANVAAIRELGRLGAVPGYSDHTLGIEAAVLAVACGARIVEKHFTIDKKHSSFRDHALAADPEEMAQLVRRIRRAEAMLGTGRKQPAPCEEGGGAAMTRSLVASRDVRVGTVLTREHIDWVRPGGGIASGGEDAVLGRALTRTIRRGEMILPEDVTPREDALAASEPAAE
jgi:N-acetylneuraminate synthase/N,N'-diacetyllegionaminate synthase